MPIFWAFSDILMTIFHVRDIFQVTSCFILKLPVLTPIFQVFDSWVPEAPVKVHRSHFLVDPKQKEWFYKAIENEGSDIFLQSTKLNKKLF